MPTVSQIGSSVLRNLDDLGANFFKLNQDVYPAIQDGYNLIAALTETISDVADVNFQSDVVYYDFSQIPNFLRVYGIYNNNTSRWLEPVGLRTLLEIRDDWELASGEPYLFYPIDFRTVALFPSPEVATGYMTVMFKAIADTLITDSTPQIPPQHSIVLEHYATQDLLTQCEEFAKAASYNSLIDTEIAGIKKVLRERTNQLYYKNAVRG